MEQEERELANREQESQERLQHETSKIQTDFVEYQDQMNELTKRVNDQLILLEAVRGNLGKDTGTAPSGAVGSDRDKEKINKPPTFPLFSGIEPTPKDECGIETLLFQVKGARKDVTEQAVRSALVSCLRGGASSFLEYVGLESSLDVMIDELTERYTKTAPTDTLVCEFHQMKQDKSESIRCFAGRIEKLFKKLQIQIPERYPDRLMLKDRLFYGMHPELKGSLRFVFSQPDMTYPQLLHACSTRC